MPAYLELTHCSPSREFRNCHKLLAVIRQTELPGTTALPISFLCGSFAELIEEMELWKWDDATGDFWSRLAKALRQSNTVAWAEQLDSRLASGHTTGKLSWAAETRSIRECKIRIERIGGSRLDTDSEVWGLDQTTWELKWAREASMRKSIPALRQAGCERFSNLPRIQQSYREKALVVIPPVIRMSTTSNGEQRVQVLIPVVQGLVTETATAYATVLRTSGLARTQAAVSREEATR